MYSTQTGRFLQKDPLGFNPAGSISKNPFEAQQQYKDGPNLFEYANSNPTVYSDALGLAAVTAPEVARGMFDRWYLEQKEDMTWWQSLPKCPKKLCFKGRFWFRRPENPDPEIWFNPARPSKPEVRLHPGTWWSMRSRPDCSGHANQCTYDRKGEIFTKYPSAGTVDYVSPAFASSGDKLSHYRSDVKPIYWAVLVDHNIMMTLYKGTIPMTIGSYMSKYFEVRPFHGE